MATPAPTAPVVVTTHSTSRRSRTSTHTPTPTFTPYDASSERHADTQRTNKILIGIFSGLGVVFLALVAFQLFRCYKRRKDNSTPLPPPRKSSMSQLGHRTSRAVSMYGEYPKSDFSRPPSVLMRKDESFGSRSAFVATPSTHSNAASTDMLGVDEAARKSIDILHRPGHAARESISDKSMTGSPLAPNDEEAGRRLSPLGSRSQSPSNISPPRPPSQAQVHPRPESRSRHPRPNSAASTSRHSFLNAGSWQHGSQRHSAYGNPNRNSYYAAGNYGAPHSPHVRDRVGLVMPQPLAPELFNYALSGRHDMGLDFMQGAWGSQGNLSQGGSSQNLAAPRRARTDSWVARGSNSSPNDSPSTSVAPIPPPKDGSLPRGRSTHPEIPRP
ncbi:hypothetical protein FRC07_002523 [Ceratobasidium sp. 392]|nr:hypothetical protein FRC07_002523 [Ceratobasidium sp. 392]